MIWMVGGVELLVVNLVVVRWWWWVMAVERWRNILVFAYGWSITSKFLLSTYGYLSGVGGGSLLLVEWGRGPV